MSERFFELHGLSHLALNSADMARTVDFYEGLLGIPLVKTLDVPGSNGGQHFFFDVGCDECLAFFYFPDMPKRDVPVDKGLGGPTPPGLMNHVAFKVSQKNFDGYRRKLDELGVKYVYIRHDTDGGYSRNPADPTNDKSFALSVYFHDPDDNVMEFCAWLPAYDQLGRDHEPAGKSAAAATKRPDHVTPGEHSPAAK
ncbi:MAG TPA: VOC family protein [Candidatus Binataceae bacterium]|nr:VOC family protein [Candidatus Binataceae bacterium]